jgi:hypothetical protein
MLNLIRTCSGCGKPHLPVLRDVSLPGEQKCVALHWECRCDAQWWIEEDAALVAIAEQVTLDNLIREVRAANKDYSSEFVGFHLGIWKPGFWSRLTPGERYRHVQEYQRLQAARAASEAAAGIHRCPECGHIITDEDD